jgi:hypothetical protein
MTACRQLFVIEEIGGRRMAASAIDAGRARDQAALLWQVQRERRDQLIVREPEAGEHATYEASSGVQGTALITPLVGNCAEQVLHRIRKSLSGAAGGAIISHHEHPDHTFKMTTISNAGAHFPYESNSIINHIYQI